jgi:serine/threonine protein kinase
LPPVSKQRPTFDFEKRIRKTIPKISLKTTNPRSQYTSELEIGTGVNGAVIQARSRGNSERLAIKRCQIDIADQDFRIAVLRELRIMASGHDNIIQLRELTLWRSELWIGMDLMRCSVFSVLCHRNIPEEFAVYIAREVYIFCILSNVHHYLFLKEKKSVNVSFLSCFYLGSSRINVPAFSRVHP